MNRHHILTALGGTAALLPGVLVPGVPWWTVALSGLGAFLTLLAKYDRVVMEKGGTGAVPSP